MNPATPDITIDIRTSEHGRNAQNPKPDDQVHLTVDGISIGNGRITVASRGSASITWVRIGNGKLSEGDNISLTFRGHKGGDGRIIAATDNFLEISYTRADNG